MQITKTVQRIASHGKNGAQQPNKSVSLRTASNINRLFQKLTTMRVNRTKVRQWPSEVVTIAADNILTVQDGSSVRFARYGGYRIKVRWKA